METTEIQRRVTRQHSDSNIQLSNPMYKDYVLNKPKAIQKKNEACSKSHIEATMKAGNNLVIEFSTAAYELAKQSLSIILNKSAQYYALARNSEESSVANVDTCIKVYNRKVDSTQGKNLKFVINLYHTSSTMVINGSRVDLYIADIHEQLRSELSAKGHMITALNDNIASSLSNAINNTTKQHLAEINTSCCDSISDLAIEDRKDEISDTEKETTDFCPICNKISLTETIECSECSLWLHYECAGLLQSTVDALTTLDYICPLCTDNMLYAVNTYANGNDKTVQAFHDSTDIHPQNGQLYLDASHKSVINDDEDVTLLKQYHNANDTSEQSYVQQILTQPQTSKNEQHNCPPFTPSVEQQAPSDNVQKKPKRTATKSAKPKIDNPEDRAYIIKLENEINKLKSTIEMQSNLTSHQHQSSAPPLNPTGTENQNFNNVQFTNMNIESKINDQRFRMLEFQMMQNMTMNNMISNQQMQVIMQQQQMIQQSYQQLNCGQPTYQTMQTKRIIPPPPGFIQNIMPPSYPYYGIRPPAFGPQQQHVNFNPHVVHSHIGLNAQVSYPGQHLTRMHNGVVHQNANQPPVYSTPQNINTLRREKLNIPQHNVNPHNNNRHNETDFKSHRKHTGCHNMPPRFDKRRSSFPSQNQADVPTINATQKEEVVTTKTSRPNFSPNDSLQVQGDNTQNKSQHLAPCFNSPGDIHSGNKAQHEISTTNLENEPQSVNLEHHHFLGNNKIKLPPDRPNDQNVKNQQERTL